jgi:hypothetical protein
VCGSNTSDLRQICKYVLVVSCSQEKPQTPASTAEVKKEPKPKGRGKRRKAEAEPEVVCVSSEADNDEVEYLDQAAPTSNGHAGKIRPV